MMNEVTKGNWAGSWFNGDFFDIKTYSGFRGGSHADFRMPAHRLSPDVTDEELGLVVLEALSKSRFVLGTPRAGSVYPPDVEFDAELYDMNLSAERYQKWLAELMQSYGYKTKRALLKNMHSCSITKMQDIITISPSHHEKLEAWGREKGDGIEDVIIPADSTPSEIGAALRLAFSRCTG